MVNRYTPKQRVRCQFCGIINYTRNLEVELVCTQSCNKYAKYRGQKLKLTKVHDKRNKKWLQVYEVVEQSKPCTDCGVLVPTSQKVHECWDKDNILQAYGEIPEGVLA